MDQPQDHKKGHVNLNVHTTKQGDRQSYHTVQHVKQTQCRIPFVNEKQNQPQLLQKVGLLWLCGETARQGHRR